MITWQKSAETCSRNKCVGRQMFQSHRPAPEAIVQATVQTPPRTLLVMVAGHRCFTGPCMQPSQQCIRRRCSRADTAWAWLTEPALAFRGDASAQATDQPPPPCAAHNQLLCLRHVLGQVGQAVRRGRLIVSLCILLWQDVLKKLSSVNTLQEGRPETCSNMARSRRTSEYMSTTSTTNSAPNRTNLNARLRFHETQRTRD